MGKELRAPWTTFFRVVRAFSGVSMVALGFPVVILAIGTSIALVIRALHDGLSWLVRLVGDPSAIGEALVTVSSVVGSVIVAALLMRLLVEFLHWRRRFRTGMMTTQTTNVPLGQRRIPETAS
jgi:hypothetical protein